MSIPVPNLDDRTFDDLVGEAVALIPVHAPEWTNHNPSDPGITLVELLAYVTEILIYRANRVDRESRLNFLRLLRGNPHVHSTHDAAGTDDDVDDAIGKEVQELARPKRAVTKADFEFLSRLAAAKAYRRPPEGIRTFCLVGRAIEKTKRGLSVHERQAAFTVVVVPPAAPFAAQHPDILKGIREAILPLSLLGTSIHVTDTIYVTIAVGAVIHTRVKRDADTWYEAAQTRLDKYFSVHPDQELKHGGWPFGRHVYLADVVEALLGIDDVDSVEDVFFTRLSVPEGELRTDDAVIGVQMGVLSSVGRSTRIGADRRLGHNRLIRSDNGRLNGIALQPCELAQVTVDVRSLRIVEERPRSE